MQTRGVISKMFVKQGSGRYGPWVADSLKIAVNGVEDPYYYRLGFREKEALDKAPPFSEGDVIEFSYKDVDEKSREIIKGTGRVLGKGSHSEPPVQAAAPAATSSNSTQQNIHYQNSRTAAIELVGILLANDGLSISGNKQKAGQAMRFDEITAAVDKLTVKFFNDLETFRLFDTVQDFGEVDTSADAELPEDEPVDEGLEDEDVPF